MKKDRLFHKYTTIAVAIILILTVGAKVYSVNNRSDTTDWNYDALQEIDHSQDNFTFIVMGDNKNAKMFDSIIDETNRENVSFLIDVGDLVIKGERAYYELFLEQAERSNKPLLTAIGNHELYDKGRADYYDIFGPFYYSFTVGDAYFIVLDDANEQGLDKWQMQWMIGELQKSQNYSLRFVFMHVPLYDPRPDIGHCLKDPAAARELNEIFDEYNVSMVFAAHIHAYFNGTWGKTPYIITGGAGGEQVGGDDPAHYFYHYIKVHVSGGNVSYEVVKLNGPDFIAQRPLYSLWLHLYVFLDVNALNIVIFLSAFYLGYFVVFIKKKWMTHQFLAEWRKKKDEKKEKVQRKLEGLKENEPPDKKI